MKKWQLVWSLSFVHSFKASCSSFSKRRVALRHSEEFLSLQNIKRGEGVATYKRHLNFLVFSLNKQVDETLSRIHRRSIQLHVLWHDSSSITERVRLYYTLWSDVPSTRGYCLWGRMEKKIQTLDLFIPGTMQWSTNGIRMASDALRRRSCSPPDVCWSSAVGFEKYTSGSSHLCLKRQ